MKKELSVFVMAASVMLTACSTAATVDTETSGTTAPETAVTETTEETTSEETRATTEPPPLQEFEHIFFGHYEQDGDESNGTEPIEWLVLAEEEDRILIISRNILDYQAYNIEFTDVTWETCTLRAWLNDDFYNAAFDGSEQERILTVTNTNPDSDIYLGATEGGNDTEDRVFLLSTDEAHELFLNDVSRAADICDWWWLRSPGKHPYYAACVLFDGEMLDSGHMVCFNFHDHGVRPVLWLSVDSEQ